MNWDLIGVIAEVVGAIAVIVSILYLAVQVGANTRSVKANAGFEAAHSWAASNELLYQVSKEDRTTFARAFDPVESSDKFSEDERMHVSIFMRSIFQKLEGQYFLFKYGNLDKGLWENRKAWGAGVLQTPFFKNWWQIEKSQLIYSPEFIEIIESARPAAIAGFANQASKSDQ